MGMTASVADFPAPVGAIVEIERQTGRPLAAEVIGFRDDLTLVYLLEDMTGVRRGNRVRLVRTSNWLRVGPRLLGRVIECPGTAIDGAAAAAADRMPFGRSAAAGRAAPRIDTAAGDRHSRHRRPADLRHADNGWEFLPARAWARA